MIYLKRFITNYLKVFITLVIYGIVFTGIGVYAASEYFARDITFTPINENFKKENVIYFLLTSSLVKSSFFMLICI